MPTVEEMKVYLGIDGDYLDSLILDFINLAQNIIERYWDIHFQSFKKSLQPLRKLQNTLFLLITQIENKQM